MRILVLGLGNELLGDDAVGVVAAELLRGSLEDDCQPHVIHVQESAESGIAFMDHFIGFDRAIVIDAVDSGSNPPGTITELYPRDLGHIIAPSPHYAGFPEMLALARDLDLHFPSDTRIYAIEAEDMHTMGRPLTPSVESAMHDVVRRVEGLVAQWREESNDA